MSRPIAERLANFASALSIDSVPPAVLERAKACILHAIIVGSAGVEAQFGQMAESAMERTNPGVPESGPSRSLVSGRHHPAPQAAFINGAHFHARAQEDTHGTFHPGVTVIPAALAAAEATGCDGKTFIEAVVVGYEVGIALSAPLTELTTPPFRATAVFGPVAAAAAAGHIFGLSPRQMTSAISISAALSGGTSESFGSGTDEWHFQSGMAAMSGLTAASLAAAGAIGSTTAFEAAAGFLDCFAKPSELAGSIATELGTTWNILGVTFKPYPVCAFNQTPAMLAARLKESGITSEKVSSVILRMNEREATYPGMPSSGPFESTAQTLMSARFSFATALIDGDIVFNSLRRFNDPGVLNLVSKIELIAESGRAPKTASAEVSLMDGSVVHDAIDDSDSLLSWNPAQVRANAQRLQAESQLSERQHAVLVDSVDRLLEADSVAATISAALGNLVTTQASGSS